MQRIVNPPDNLFIDGDAGTGTPGTRVTAAWLNSLQEEVAAVIESESIELDSEETQQLLEAIAAKFNAAATAWAAADSSHAGLTSPHSATSAATPSRIIVRDANGRAQVAAPSAAADIARKDTVESEATARAAADSSHAAATTTHGASGAILGTGNLTATLTEIGKAASGIGVTIPRQKVVAIGDWNMDSTGSVAVAHGLTLAKIIGARAMVRNDDDSHRYVLPDTADDTAGPDTRINIDGTNVNIERRPGDLFDSTDFNNTSYNRGWIIIDYLD